MSKAVPYYTVTGHNFAFIKLDDSFTPVSTRIFHDAVILSWSFADVYVSTRRFVINILLGTCIHTNKHHQDA